MQIIKITRAVGFAKVLLILLLCSLLNGATGGLVWKSARTSVYLASELLTDHERENFLKIHNNKRASEGSSSMNKMVWNETLAEMALDWARTCKWYRGQPEGYGLTNEGVGQNRWFGSQKNDDKINVTEVTDFWHLEKAHYNYIADKCDDGNNCDDYLQMIWDRSYMLGCGYKICSELRTKDGSVHAENVAYVVCNYWPPKKTALQRPFQKGPSCSRCHDGYMTCNEKLCLRVPYSECEPDCVCNADCKNQATMDDNECKCHCAPGWKGVDCAEHCVDKPECETLNHTLCQSRAWMKENCPRYCGICELRTDGTAPESKEMVGAIYIPPKTEDGKYVPMFPGVISNNKPSRDKQEVKGNSTSSTPPRADVLLFTITIITATVN